MFPAIGRGVFAVADFECGEVVDVCPYIVDDTGEVHGKVLDYVWDEEDCSLVFLGNGSLFNHSDYENLQWEFKGGCFSRTRQEEQFAIFFAKRKILAGEELTIDYGSGYWEDREKVDN